MRACVALGAVLLALCCALSRVLLAAKLQLAWNAAGSRYVSWLPSFSVEVTRVRDPPAPHLLDAMIEQVQQVFPQYPRALLAADLATSRHADRTIDNILEGRLPPPPAAAPSVASPDPSAAGVTSSGAPSAPTQPEHGAAQSAEPMHPERSASPTEPEATSSQFSQNASEREAMLRRRKEALLESARRRYLERQGARAAAPPAPRS